MFVICVRYPLGLERQKKYQIKNQDVHFAFVSFLAQSVRDCGSGRFVNDAQHVETSNSSRILEKKLGKLNIHSLLRES